MKTADVVLLSTADWDNPFWTNKQHVAMALVKAGHRVFYIDSLGLRRPCATGRDFRRVGKRLLKAMRPPSRVCERLWVWSPIVLPFHGNRYVRRVNRFLLEAGLRFWFNSLGLRRQWFWTYSPLADEFFNLSAFTCRVYHCVDEIKAQPGMPVAVLESTEERLARKVDVIFTTSPRLTETRKAWNDNVYYLPNVADYEHFSQALQPELEVPNDLASMSGPKIGFVGAISGYKLDFQLIRKVAEARPDWSLVFIGEIGEGDPWTDHSLLEGLPNLHLMGPRAYSELPAYLKGFDVALLPNKINEYTDSMFPMKFFEYLAAGRSVVSVNLKAIQEFAGYVGIADNSDEFIAKIEAVLRGRVPSLQARLELASKHTYEARTSQMRALVRKICEDKVLRTGESCSAAAGHLKSGE